MEERTYDEIDVIDEMETTEEETSDCSGKKNGTMRKLLVGTGIVAGVGVAAYLIKNRKKIKENRKRRRIDELRAEGYYIEEPNARSYSVTEDDSIACECEEVE